MWAEPQEFISIKQAAQPGAPTTEVKISSAYAQMDTPSPIKIAAKIRFWKKNGKFLFYLLGGCSLSLYMYNVYICIYAYNCTLEKDSGKTLVLASILVARMMSSRCCGLQWVYHQTKNKKTGKNWPLTESISSHPHSPPISSNLQSPTLR